MTKVVKGSTGEDSRFLASGRSKAVIFVATLRSEGSREGIGFVAKDADSALKAVTGGNFQLQDVISAGTLSTAKSVDGFSYELDGPTSMTARLVTGSDGRLFAFFLEAPAAEFAAKKELFQSLRDSFTTYALP